MILLIAGLCIDNSSSICYFLNADTFSNFEHHLCVTFYLNIEDKQINLKLKIEKVRIGELINHLVTVIIDKVSLTSLHSQNVSISNHIIFELRVPDSIT